MTAPTSAVVTARITAVREIAKANISPSHMVARRAYLEPLFDLVGVTPSPADDPLWAATDLADRVRAVLDALKVAAPVGEAKFIDCVFGLTREWRQYDALTHRREIWVGAKPRSGVSTTSVRHKENRLYLRIVSALELDAMGDRGADPEDLTSDPWLVARAALECARTWMVTAHRSIVAFRTEVDGTLETTMVALHQWVDAQAHGGLELAGVLCMPALPLGWWFRPGPRELAALVRFRREATDPSDFAVLLEDSRPGRRAIEQWDAWWNQCKCEHPDIHDRECPIDAAVQIVDARNDALTGYDRDRLSATIGSVDLLWLAVDVGMDLSGVYQDRAWQS
jgi:hypothetical protein